MMYKEQIDEQINRLRNHMRILQRRYNAMPSDDTYDELMFYKAKIDSWKRVREKAPNMMVINSIGQVVPFNPIRKNATLAEILANAMMPDGIGALDG